MYLWDELSTSDCTGWVLEGRKKHNRVVRLANEWQTEHRFDVFKGQVVIAEIELGLRTWAMRDGGGLWRGTLEEIQDFVNKAFTEMEK